MATTHVLPLQFSAAPTLDVQLDTARLELVGVGPGEACRLEVQQGPERVSITPRSRGPFGFNADARRLKLFVPPHVRACVRNDLGRVSIEHLAGCDLTVASLSGTVDLDDVRGRLTVGVDSGSVRGTRLGGTFDVRGQAGSARLAIDALDEGTHRVATTLGSVRVELASGQEVQLETSTSLGSVRARYPSTPGAKAVLQLSADSGSVKVTDGGEARDARHGDWPDWRKRWEGAVASVLEAVPVVAERTVEAVVSRRPPPWPTRSCARCWGRCRRASSPRPTRSGCCAPWACSGRVAARSRLTAQVTAGDPTLVSLEAQRDTLQARGVSTWSRRCPR